MLDLLIRNAQIRGTEGLTDIGVRGGKIAEIGDLGQANADEVFDATGLTVMPGVIDSLTNYVEHPQLIAERIERFAQVVGRDRVIAGTDCGFGTFAGFNLRGRGT